MKKLFSFLFVLLFLPIFASSYRYDLSMCMIFRDEAPYLKEWIEFHHMLGVDHFYLYNNLSTDNYKEVLQPYINKGLVELTEWSFESTNAGDWNSVQLAAYNDGLSKAKETSRWLAILDSDEFLFPTSEKSIPKFLEKYKKKKGFGGLTVNWVCFGTSWVEKIPDNKLLIETLVLSASSGSEHFKSIFLTKRASFVCSPHHISYKKGYRHFTPNSGNPPLIEINDIRINHYWSRDEWFLNNVKIPRRQIWGTDASFCKLWAEASNQDYDTKIFRFINPLRKRVFSVK